MCLGAREGGTLSKHHQQPNLDVNLSAGDIPKCPCVRTCAEVAVARAYAIVHDQAALPFEWS